MADERWASSCPLRWLQDAVLAGKKEVMSSLTTYAPFLASAPNPPIWSVSMSGRIPAKKLSAPDNGGQQVLCKAKFCSVSRTDSTLCFNSRLPSVDSPNLGTLDGSWSIFMPKAPLRLITSRTPVFGDLYSNGTQKLMWYLDTLDCGHQTVVYPFDEISGKKRHRCAECAQAVAKKKPQSVKLTRKKAA